ncbi:MAG: hypothetical protein ACKODY_02895 [Actinomycetota bacterium]
MRRDEYVLGEVFSYRFTGPEPTHALLIQHGIASHGGIYDNLCAHHARRAHR